MSKELFADSIGALGISKGVVRIDLVTQSATEKNAKGEPKEEFCQRVVMPVEGFLRTFGMMQSLMQKLQEAGLVKPKAGNDQINITAPKTPAKR
jgi:hypothetical protein